jgi:hypothetical protein
MLDNDTSSRKEKLRIQITQKLTPVKNIKLKHKGWYWYFRIPDMETPKDRMVQLVRWYLSAFHAGRNSEIAKKPYNPILGETLFWNINTNLYSLPNFFVLQIQKDKL